jgi:hypothetical protein
MALSETDKEARICSGAGAGGQDVHHIFSSSSHHILFQYLSFAVVHHIFSFHYMPFAIMVYIITLA